MQILVKVGLDEKKREDLIQKQTKELDHGNDDEIYRSIVLAIDQYELEAWSN